MNDTATTPSEDSTHGFLFADLRGYAQLVDTRGGIEATVRPNPVGTCEAGSARLWGVGGRVWGPNTGDAILFEALDDGARTLTVVFAANSAGELLASEGAGRRLIESIVLRQ